MPEISTERQVLRKIINVIFRVVVIIYIPWMIFHYYLLNFRKHVPNIEKNLAYKLVTSGGVAYVHPYEAWIYDLAYSVIYFLVISLFFIFLPERLTWKWKKDREKKEMRRRNRKPWE